MDSFYIYLEMMRGDAAWYWKGYKAWETKLLGYRSVPVPHTHRAAFEAGAGVARHRNHEASTHPGCNQGVLVHPLLPC